jgi:tetratricopeptide (TPR) repeat protein
MNKQHFNAKIPAACVMLALVISAQAAEPEVTEEEPIDNTDSEQLETISVDTLPAPESDDLNDEEDFTVDQPTEKESNLDELRLSFALYKEAIANASYDEADTLAKRMVELTIRLFGLDSHESAKALTNLGRVQQKNQDYESAVLNFTASIDIIERIEDRLNAELINPLRGLGAAQLGAGRPDLARQSFERAVHVSHVNEGPHNMMQIRVLEELAETHLSMGNRDDALDVHQFIYNIEARNTDLSSEAIIPALERQAEWTHRMRMHERERTTWRKIIHILEDSRGKKDLSLISPLTGLGNSYLFVSDFELEAFGGAAITSGDAYLRRAVRIAQQNPESDWQVERKTLLALADFYILSNRAAKAGRTYKETWDLLSVDEERMASRFVVLERTHVLQKINPPKYYNSARTDNGDSAPESFESGKIVVAYSVSSRGDTGNIRIIEADPAGLDDMEFTVTRELRRLIHRPRMADGVPVDTHDRTYTHEFFYRPSDVPVPEQDKADQAVVAEES